MSITPVDKAQAMRPAEIAAIDALNLAIAQLNQLDIGGLNTRLATMENNIAALQTAINDTNGILARLASCENTNTTQQSDIDDIKVTLYTPLNATS